MSTATCCIAQHARVKWSVNLQALRSRWQTAQCLQARAACEGALAGQIPAYKLDMLLRQLTDMRHHNDTLAQQLKVMSQRLLAAEQAKDESDIKLQHTEYSQVSCILSRHIRFCMHWLIVRK